MTLLRLTLIPSDPKWGRKIVVNLDLVQAITVAPRTSAADSPIVTRLYFSDEISWDVEETIEDIMAMIPSDWKFGKRDALAKAATP